MEREATFQYQILRVPDSEAANCLFINGTLIHRSKEEYPESAKVLSELGCETLELNGSEMAKAQVRSRVFNVSQQLHEAFLFDSLFQGALTCCSILIRKPKHIRSL